VYREINVDAEDTIVYDGNVFGIPRSLLDDYGVLADVFLPYSDQVSFNIGGRVDYCRAWLDRNDPVVTEISDPEAWYYTPGFNQPSNVLGMAYITNKIKLTEDRTFNAGIAYAMRMPDLAELYSDDPYVPIARLGNSYVSGNSTLSPEHDLQFDLGISVKKKQISYAVRGFYALTWNYIMPVPAYIDPSPPGSIQAPKVLGRDFQAFPPEFRMDLVTGNVNADTNQAGYQYENVEMVTLTGGDLSAEVRLRDWFSVYGNMAYVCGTNWHPVQYVDAGGFAADGEVVPLGGTEGLPNIYPFYGMIAFRVFDPSQERWLLEFSSRMVSSQNYVATSLSELPNSGFATFAIRGYYQARKNLQLTMGIENLFNQEYSEPGSLVIINPQGIPTLIKEPGITVLLGINGRF